LAIWGIALIGWNGGIAAVIVYGLNGEGKTVIRVQCTAIGIIIND